MLGSHVRRWAIRLVLAGLLIGVTLIVGGGVQAVVSVPDLQTWHRLAPRSEVTADALDDDYTLAQDPAREAEVFDQVRDEIETPFSASAPVAHANRYQSSSISSPRRLARDWNRTFELQPPGAVVGGALLIHGLTDSPYSMRAVAHALSAQGYYVLALRMPGHGTVPAALTRTTAEDWMAAVRMERAMSGRRSVANVPWCWSAIRTAERRSCVMLWRPPPIPGSRSPPASC